MTEHHSTLRTPMREDKRFILAMYALTLIFGALVLHVPLPEYVIGAFIAITLGYGGVSQWGQTKRTTELLKAAAPIEPEPDVKVEVKG